MGRKLNNTNIPKKLYIYRRKFPDTYFVTIFFTARRYRENPNPPIAITKTQTINNHRISYKIKHNSYSLQFKAAYILLVSKYFSRSFWNVSLRPSTIGLCSSFSTSESFSRATTVPNGTYKVMKRLHGMCKAW